MKVQGAKEIEAQQRERLGKKTIETEVTIRSLFFFFFVIYRFSLFIV